MSKGEDTANHPGRQVGRGRWDQTLIPKATQVWNVQGSGYSAGHSFGIDPETNTSRNTSSSPAGMYQRRSMAAARERMYGSLRPGDDGYALPTVGRVLEFKNRSR